ncbi:MAG: hypothetical protein PHG06_21820 [Parabacteroides sp.]|nr:hypothetical protein [Parabacteroides sp.]
MEETEELEGVEQVAVVHGVGERVTEITDGGLRMGFVIAQDENSMKAVEDFE